MQSVKFGKGIVVHNLIRLLVHCHLKRCTCNNSSELLIDENDVNASHAMSIGRVDDDQLYYLDESWIICKAMYFIDFLQDILMPVTDTLNNDVLKEKLQEEMERKLNELC